jgi:hypothetical protein
MRLTNYDNTRIFWRIFDKGDTVHIIGYKEGTIDPGQWNDISHPHENFQLEVKRKNLQGGFIQTAGTQYHNDGEGLVVNAGHTFSETDYALANIEIDDGEGGEDSLPLVLFVDQTQYPYDTTIEISSSIESSQNSSGEAQSTHSSSYTDTKTSSVGGKLDISGEGNNVKAGISASFNISDTLVDGIQNQVKIQRNQSMSTSYKETRKYTQVYHAGKILAIETAQSRKYISGNIILGPDRVKWQMPFEFNPSIRPSVF